MIHNTEHRYMIFESQNKQFSKKIGQMMIIDQDSKIDIWFSNLKIFEYQYYIMQLKIVDNIGDRYMIFFMKKIPPDKGFKPPGFHYHIFCQHDQTNRLHWLIWPLPLAQ